MKYLSSLLKNTPIIALFLGGFISSAHACIDCDDLPIRWGFSANLGATQYKAMYLQDGQSALGRLSLESRYPFSEFASIALEAGIQNGNAMRLALPKSTLDLLGGEPVFIHVKPMIDVLLSAQIKPMEDLGFFGSIKGGIAFRQMQVDRNEVNDLSKVSPEIQAGLGYQINDYMAIHFHYQHVFGGDPNYQVNETLTSATISNIPSQNSVLLGLTLII